MLKKNIFLMSICLRVISGCGDNFSYCNPNIWFNSYTSDTVGTEPSSACIEDVINACSTVIDNAAKHCVDSKKDKKDCLGNAFSSCISNAINNTSSCNLNPPSMQCSGGSGWCQLQQSCNTYQQFDQSNFYLSHRAKVSKNFQTLKNNIQTAISNNTSALLSAITTEANELTNQLAEAQSKALEDAQKAVSTYRDTEAACEGELSMAYTQVPVKQYTQVCAPMNNSAMDSPSCSEVCSAIGQTYSGQSSEAEPYNCGSQAYFNQIWQQYSCAGSAFSFRGMNACMMMGGMYMMGFGGGGQSGPPIQCCWAPMTSCQCYQWQSVSLSNYTS